MPLSKLANASGTPFFEQGQSGGIKAGECFRPQLLDHTRQSSRVNAGERLRWYFLELIRIHAHPVAVSARVNAVLADSGVEAGERLRCQLLPVGR